MWKSPLVPVVALVPVMAVGLSILSAQQVPQEQPLQFEIAAIRPGNPQLGVYSSSSGGVPGGQFRIVNMPLKQWVEMGLSVRASALNAPLWLNTSRYDLSARLPAGRPADQNAVAEMMKALLIERFNLKWHEELRNVSGFILLPDKKVLAKPTTSLEKLQGHGQSSGPTLIGGSNMTMSDFAGALGEVLGKPVKDETHLSGGYNIRLVWSATSEVPGVTDKSFESHYGDDINNISSIITAVREQLGLRLQAATLPVKVIVVDHMNRDPVRN